MEESFWEIVVGVFAYVSIAFAVGNIYYLAYLDATGQLPKAPPGSCSCLICF